MALEEVENTMLYRKLKNRIHSGRMKVSHRFKAEGMKPVEISLLWSFAM